jgi:hypothetical protein
VDLLVDFMGTSDPEIAKRIKKDEHEADVIKIGNIHTLNEAFATPIDREDIYRAIMDLDGIVNFCKDTVSEMDALGVAPGPLYLRDGGLPARRRARHGWRLRRLGHPARPCGHRRRHRAQGRPPGGKALSPRPGGPVPGRTTSTCSSAGRSTSTWPGRRTAWPTAPTPSTTSW